jgi:hypothetical protein
VRFLLEIRGRFLDVTAGRSGPEPEHTPEPQGSTCGVLERVPSWDHDQRVPLGFAARTEGKS